MSDTRTTCGTCGTTLDRPGDYCLVCRSANADGVVIEVDPDRATITMLADTDPVGAVVVTTVPETGDRERTTARRNYAERVAAEVRRKRPEAVYAAGDRDLVRSIQADLRYPVYRVEADDPVGTAIGRRDERDLAVDHRPPAAKLGGSHSTVIGGRTGRRILETIAGHPHVKKIVPGAIDAGGTGSQRGTHAKATRADTNGNLRVLIRDGSSVQAVHVVTTAMDRDRGERIREDLTATLKDEGYT